LQTQARAVRSDWSSDGSFIYTPTTDFHGARSFAATATTAVDSAPAVVAITVGNDAPTVVNDSLLTDDEDAQTG